MLLGNKKTKKMKGLKSLLVLMAVMSCVSVVCSCGDDDGSSDTPSYASKKKLVNLKGRHQGYDDINVCYDDKGRLLEISWELYKNDPGAMDFDWKNNRIFFSGVDNVQRGVSYASLVLDKYGRISQMTFDEDLYQDMPLYYKYIYSNDGYLSEIIVGLVGKDETYTVASLNYEDGLLKSFQYDGGQYTFKYYQVIDNPANIIPEYRCVNRFFPWLLNAENVGSVLLSSGLFGKVFNKMISFVKNEEERDESKFTYRYDEDGFPISCTAGLETVTFTWK